MYNQNRTVTAGSVAHSLSKNQLEEINRGPNHEVPDRSVDGYSTDYDSEGDEGMELIVASMPSLTAWSLVPSFPQPPTTDSGAGVHEFQPPDPFPSTNEPSPVEWNAFYFRPPALEAEQANKVAQSVEEVPSSDEEPPGLEPVLSLN